MLRIVGREMPVCKDNSSCVIFSVFLVRLISVPMSAAVSIVLACMRAPKMKMIFIIFVKSNTLQKKDNDPFHFWQNALHTYKRQRSFPNADMVEHATDEVFDRIIRDGVPAPWHLVTVRSTIVGYQS